MKNTGLIITIIILAVLVVAMGCYIVYDNFFQKETPIEDISENKEVHEEVEATDYTYENLEGLYKHTVTTTDDHGNEFYPSFELYLYDNGTFHYMESGIFETGQLGNYIIEDDAITLNYLFRHGSDPTLHAMNNGTLKLMITPDGTLIGPTPPNPWFESESITLGRLENTEDPKTYESFQMRDFSHYINNSYLFNDSEHMS